MSRCALLALCVAAACSKSAGNQDKVSAPPPASPSGADMIAVPKGPNPMGGAGEAAPAAKPAGTQDDPRYKLKPEEGKLAIQPPTDAKAGAETVARIVVTPGAGYHVNTEYPSKLTLTPPEGMTLAKDKFIAGGHDKSRGDADTMDEKELAFTVKLTPGASGSYTVHGSFKFAVCDRDQCLPKQENIAIAVAAK